jgi:hypothetical protein
MGQAAAVSPVTSFFGAIVVSGEAMAAGWRFRSTDPV